MIERRTRKIEVGKGRTVDVPTEYTDFVLTYSSNPEEYGYTQAEVEEILKCLKEDRLEDRELDCETMHDIGAFFENGVCVKPDIKAAVYWYELAVECGSDLAKSDLADILRKGSQGYPKDLRRAFDLYKDCGLPYAHYRVGEFYEHGWGVEQDKESAKAYYRLALKEGHGLAERKLKEWNYLE